ncbi:alpha/beta fold hydrolase [Acidisoma cladoniae]|jgi:esterase|uniref:alpha/beta fold hydrolase n=1 Tax=Acidisoma cladoniae TaxID=3040935 RepID=UPI00254C3BBF|nr:alpha/beta fold hydrolase [Acidisoma sp. PAMC 29798]
MRLHAIDVGTDGARPPVVLLHGLFGSIRNLGGLQKSLAATGRRVISLDLRNHGDSPHARGMRYGTMAEDVVESLAAMGALPCHLLGHSMGGKVAMRLALDSPDRVASLIVADIAPRAYAHGNTELAGALMALPLHSGMTRAEANAALAPAIPDATIRSFLLLNLRLGGDQPPAWRIGLADIAAAVPDLEGWEGVGGSFAGPTLFVSGGKSHYVPAEAHEAIRALFPRATFTVLPDAGHWLHAEDPAGFLAAIVPFLDAQGGA